MTREQVQAKLKEEIVKQVAMGHQMEATRKLHEAAAIMANNPLCEMYREQMHNLLDLQLDTLMSISLLTRQLVDLKD